MEERDLFEDYDIRINSHYVSLLLSEQENSASRKDHEKALPTKRLKTLPTQDYLRKYGELMIKNPAILPAGCRYVEPLDNGDHIYVIEQQPQFRTVAMALSFDLMYAEIKSGQPDVEIRRKHACNEDRDRDRHDCEADRRRLERRAAVDLAAADNSVPVARSGAIGAQLADHGVVAALDTNGLVAPGARQAGHPIGMPVADGYGGFRLVHVDRNLPIRARYSAAYSS